MPFPRPRLRRFPGGHHHDPSPDVGPGSTLGSAQLDAPHFVPDRVRSTDLVLGKSPVDGTSGNCEPPWWSQVRPLAHVARPSSGDAGVGSAWPAREIAQRRRGDPAVHVASRPGLWLAAWSCRRPMHKIHFLLATRGGRRPAVETGVREQQGRPSPLRKVSRSLPEAVEATGLSSGGFIFHAERFRVRAPGTTHLFPLWHF